MTDYGQMIKKAREEAGITQEALGKAIGVSGVTIMRYEKGQRNPSSKVIGEIAEVLGEPFLKLFLAASDEFMAKTKERLRKLNSLEWEEVPFDRVHADQQAHLENRMKQAFSALNKVGQKVACERVEELAKIDDYKRTEPPETLSADGEYTDTTQKEKPSEGAETPTGGNNES